MNKAIKIVMFFSALIALGILSINWKEPMDSSLFVNEAPSKETLVGDWTITWDGLKPVNGRRINLVLKTDGAFHADGLPIEKISGHDLKKIEFTGDGQWSLRKDMSWQISLTLEDHSGHELTIRKNQNGLILDWHFYSVNNENKVVLEKVKK